MRICLWLLLVLALSSQVCPSAPGTPVASIDAQQSVDVATYPRLLLIAGSAAYFAPDLKLNYFYYDGSFWVYQRDEWYRSGWYDGPWLKVDPLVMPLSVLQIPVTYYGIPPLYFSPGRIDAPPRWDLHWGAAWARYRGVWDRFAGGAAAVPAPTPDYQRFYAGSRYPDPARQLALRARFYSYRSHEPMPDAPATALVNLSVGRASLGSDHSAAAPASVHR
jgi:hypothetical protein